MPVGATPRAEKRAALRAVPRAPADASTRSLRVF